MVQDQTGKTDNLLKTGSKASVELTEDQLNTVAGGQAKSADKAFKAVDGYIRG